MASAASEHENEGDALESGPHRVQASTGVLRRTLPARADGTASGTIRRRSRPPSVSARDAPLAGKEVAVIVLHQGA